MTSLEQLESKRPELVAVLKEYSLEELLENYATEVLEKDEAEANSKLNAVDFGWLSARVQDFLKKMYGKDHSAMITQDKALIVFEVETFI